MIDMERVRSLSVFLVPCRLQPKVLSVFFFQEKAVFEVLIRKMIKVQSSIILCMQRTGLSGLKAIARISIVSL